MKTLIELCDPSPIENVLGTEIFRPDEMILICPSEVEGDHAFKRSLRKYFEYRGCDVKLTFIYVSMVNAVKIERVLREVLASHQDCAIDISGGTDAALFAAGAASGDNAVFTYSRRRNAFFEIRNAPYARNKPCELRLDAKSCVLMACGELLPGRADNAAVKDMLPQVDKLFAVYGKYRRIWNHQISFIQKISSSEAGVLEAEGPWKASAGNKNVTANAELFRELEAAGLIEDLSVSKEGLRFRFPNETIRFWLRDIGAVLELQVYRACLAAGCFDDVVLSAVVNWQDGGNKRDSVTNEIDVMAVQGIQPVFISCKTSEIRTEALNELAILRERFGGKYARSIIVTSSMATKNRAPMRNRAAKLGIEVVEWDDLALDRLIGRLNNQSMG